MSCVWYVHEARRRPSDGELVDPVDGRGPRHVHALIGGDFYFAGRIVEPVHDEPRWLALGEDATGRRLSLVFTRRGDRLRPISCRAMRRKETALYEEARRQED